MLQKNNFQFLSYISHPEQQKKLAVLDDLYAKIISGKDVFYAVLL